MMNKRLSPLQQLRQEKRAVKQEYKQEEERLLHNWEYLSHNVGSLFFNTVLNTAKGVVGIKSQKKPATPFDQEVGSYKSVLNALSSSFPIIWEIAQPMLIGYMVKRVKSIFSSKKKGRRED